VSYLDALFALTGKRALVTGAAGGIGGACANALAAAGSHVVLADVAAARPRLDERAARMADEHGVTVTSTLTDVASPAEVRRMVEQTVHDLGGLDIVFSNAGVISGANLDVDIDYEAWRRNVDVNLDGMFLVGREAARVMIAQGTGGSIINTASMSGMVVNDILDATRGGSAYPAAKAGVIHLTKSQATQWVDHGIRVNAVSPGYVKSGIHQGIPQSVLDYCARRTPMKRFGTIEEVAGAVLFLAGDASSFVTGANLVVDGGYTCWWASTVPRSCTTLVGRTSPFPGGLHDQLVRIRRDGSRRHLGPLRVQSS
jgi:sorbose reductase